MSFNFLVLHKKMQQKKLEGKEMSLIEEKTPSAENSQAVPLIKETFSGEEFEKIRKLWVASILQQSK